MTLRKEIEKRKTSYTEMFLKLFGIYLAFKTNLPRNFCGVLL